MIGRHSILEKSSWNICTAMTDWDTKSTPAFKRQYKNMGITGNAP